MGARIYQLFNGAAPSGTGVQTKQPTGSAATRTQLQIEIPSTSEITIIEWGISFDGSAAATPVLCELLGCTGAATMSTATVAADIAKVNKPAGLASNVTLGGTTHTGFATAAVTEGTVANARMLDAQEVPPSSGYVKQYPLGREPVGPNTTFLRIRTTAPSPGFNCLCYVTWEEG